MAQYLRFSRSAYYGVAVAALPLLVAYELLLTAVGYTAHGQVRNAGDVWLRMILASLNVRPSHATLAMILILVLTIPVVRRREIRLKPGYLGLMLLEALGYSLALGIVINIILAFILTALSSGMHPGLAVPAGLSLRTGALEGLALSLGAGLFEEFIFRVVLLGLLLAVTRMVLASWLAAMISIVAASFLFALAHYVGPYGDAFTIVSFLFRFVAGLLFTGLYYLRGFAVTAYTHAFYDIRVILF